MLIPRTQSTSPQSSTPRGRERLALSLLSSLSLSLLLSAPLSAAPAVSGEVVGEPSGEAPGPNPFPGERGEEQAPALQSAGGFVLSFEGYTQLRYQQIEDDEQLTDFVGRNDGFSLSNARLRITGRRGDTLQARIEIDGARDRRVADNRAEGEVRAEVLDAWLAFTPSRYFQLHAGRLKPFFDRAEMLLTEELLFVDRPLESRGVFGVEGLNVEGLSLRREVGLRLDGDLALGSEEHLLRWFLSLTNGNDGRQPLNDNDQLAYTGRLQLDSKISRDFRFSLGGAFRFNEISRGTLPDLVSERRTAYTFDGTMFLYGLLLEGQYMHRRQEALDVDVEPEFESAGWHGSVGFRLGRLHQSLRGFVPAYRYATYDPTSSFESGDETLQGAYEIDALTHHTLGLSWFLNRTYASEPPLKLQLNYTLTEEHPQRALTNDRLDLMLQLIF